jgi:hypothetical protein
MSDQVQSKPGPFRKGMTLPTNYLSVVAVWIYVRVRS